MAPTLQTNAIIDAVASEAMASGYFDRVNRHDAQESPGTGLTATVWINSIRPTAKMSGLAVSSAMLLLNLRVYTNLMDEPRDMVDPNLADSVDALMTAFAGGFTLGGLVREVDLLGEQGVPLAAQFGYIDIGGSLYRCATITVPCLVADVWGQAT